MQAVSKDRQFIGSSPRRTITQKLDEHVIASIFPKMDAEDYASLVEDIRVNGLRTPVVLYAGKILDGRNRYEACGDADVECQFETYSGNDPVGYAVSLNLKRRHLSTQSTSACRR